ncbi:MAG: dTDP-4-dehydrorhamnose 3,5-epimerase family protein [Candidatus Doudnabacteria bacterium]|nr:dTDP-4-dehydrorhamnose 3,5-epimerase family protein [Candidatus Doudnabacteria bacterium]
MPTTEYKITTTEIPGLLIIDIAAVSDDRGYFQEKYQKQKLTSLGFPESFVPVQQNISYNKQAGVLRGLHAEPWDKYVTVTKGKVFGAWVDLRKENFGKVVTAEIDEHKAVFVPQGVANAYQTLEPEVYYCYLVNDHWKPDGIYKSVNPGDPELQISWPITFDQAIISEKDHKNALLKDIVPF